MARSRFWVPTEEELTTLIAEHGPSSLSQLQKLGDRDERGRVDFYALRALVAGLGDKGRLQRFRVTRGRGAPFYRFTLAPESSDD